MVRPRTEGPVDTIYLVIPGTRCLLFTFLAKFQGPLESLTPSTGYLWSTVGVSKMVAKCEAGSPAKAGQSTQQWYSASHRNENPTIHATCQQALPEI